VAGLSDQYQKEISELRARVRDIENPRAEMANSRQQRDETPTHGPGEVDDADLDNANFDEGAEPLRWAITSGKGPSPREEEIGLSILVLYFITTPHPLRG
jgi:hypothetical protein